MVKKILLTGATSFLGRRFCRIFNGKGFELISTATQNSKDGTILSMNLTNMQEVSEVVKSVSPDIVVHTGAYVNLDRDFSVATKCMEVNVMGTTNLLETLKQTPPELFIYISSEEVYGNGAIPFIETQRVDPPSPYAISKVAAEHLCQWYGAQYGFSSVIVRFGTFYGPEQPENKYFAQIITKALKNETIPVNSGTKKRDYIYIDDAIDLLTKIIQSNTHVSIVNGTGGQSYQLIDVIKKIIAFSCSTSQMQIGAIPDRITEREEWIANISLAKEMYKWTPVTNIDVGLEQTVAYFRDKVE